MSYSDRRVRYPSDISDVLAAFLLFALALIAYSNILGYFFTGRDAISFVAEGRITRLSDLLGFFTRQQFSGSSFQGAFYRPITSLSFALDYALWGLDPRGYHLTDLFIHATVGILTYLLGRRVLMLSRWASFLGAALFVIHPTHQGTLPVIARRIDPIATLFAFLSVLLFVEGARHTSTVGERRSRIRQGLQIASWIAYALALFSKETAIVVPAILLLWAAGESREQRRRTRWLAALVRVIPYLLITLAYLVVRTLVLHGLGGYADRQPLALDPNRWLDLTQSYLTLLLNPLPYWLHSSVAGTGIAIVTVLLVTVVAYLRSRFLGGRGGRYAPGILWITLQLALLLAVQTLTTQHAYVALAWLGLLLAGLIEDSWRLLQSARSHGHMSKASFRLPPGREVGAHGMRPHGHAPAVCLVALLGLVWASILALVVLRASPLFERPAAWYDVSESQRKFLVMLEDKIASAPDGTRIELVNLPFLQPQDPWERQVAYLTWLADYSIRDWLTMRFPRRRWNLQAEFNTAPCPPLNYTFIEIRPSPGVVQYHIRYSCDII